MTAANAIQKLHFGANQPDDWSTDFTKEECKDLLAKISSRLDEPPVDAYSAEEVSRAIVRVTRMGEGKIGVILRVLAAQHAEKEAWREALEEGICQ